MVYTNSENIHNWVVQETRTILCCLGKVLIPGLFQVSGDQGLFIEDLRVVVTNDKGHLLPDEEDDYAKMVMS